MNEIAKIGHNRSPFDLASEAIETLHVEASNWLDGEAIETQGQADAVSKLLDEARKAKREADKARREEAKPFDDGKAAVQARYKPLLTRADTIADACKKLLAPFLAAQERAKREAERKAREEADAKAEAARKAYQEAQATDLAAREEAERLIEDAKAAERAPCAARYREAARVRGRGRFAGRWCAVSEDMIVDSFAGGGGASTGIEMALGRSPDLAINHDSEAIRMHAANHPQTRHLDANIYTVDPLDQVRRGSVGLAWFSPDCRHFSKAKGSAPVARNIRDLAWVVVSWARRVRPRVIMLENVEEFVTWGPVDVATNRPIPERAGETFKAWVGALRRLGYRVQWRELRACDYGAPTIRKRLFLIARCDGQPIVWPEPTHGSPADPRVISGELLPWRTAAEIIDWSLPCPSIFATREEIWREHGLRAVRPLAEATMRRIARGVVRYVLQAQEPFIVSLAHGDSGGRREYGCDEPLGTVHAGGRSRAIVVPTLIQTGQGERQGQAPRAPGLEKPLGTVVAAGGRHALVAAFLAQHNGGPRPGQPGRPATDPVSTLTATGSQQALVAAHITKFRSGTTGFIADEPMHTITANSFHKRPGGAPPFGVVAASMISMKGTERRDAAATEPLRTICAGGGHAAMISAFLTKYYGQGVGAEIGEPMHTVTTLDRFGLVTVSINGTPYAISDIGMRMLSPRELYNAQGFPADYIIDQDGDGHRFGKAAQIRMAGNSVCPPLAAALINANCADLAAERIAA